jgi:hypothetical protein
MKVYFLRCTDVLIREFDEENEDLVKVAANNYWRDCQEAQYRPPMVAIDQIVIMTEKQFLPQSTLARIADKNVRNLPESEIGSQGTN